MARVAFAVVLALAITASQASAYPVFAGSSTGSTPFTTKPVTFETVAGIKVRCSSFEANYTVRSETELNLAVSAYTCTVGKSPCHTVYPYNRSDGQLGLELRGSLVYLNKAKRKVGIDFEPYPPSGFSGPRYVRIECRGHEVEYIEGQAIAAITPIDRLSQTFHLALTQTGGVQALTSFEGSGTQVLTTSFEGPHPPEESAIGLAATLGFASQLEIAG